MERSVRVEVAAYVCSHVFEKKRPVLLVVREGGDWQFLCGGEHDRDAIPLVIGMNHLIESDPSLAELDDLPSDWQAERSSVGLPWRRSPLSS